MSGAESQSTGTTQPRAPTGIAGLDQVLRGGFPRDRLHLISGPSGAGKTTLALQFLMEGARSGETALYIGTSETQAEIELVAQSHGWDLSGVEIRHQIQSSPHGPGPEQTMLHPAELELPRTMEQLVRVVDQVRPQRLVVDSLSEIRMLAREENWFRDQIRVLQQHLDDWRCTVLLTDLFDHNQAVLRSAVHGVIQLEQQATVYGPDRRKLRVVKMRGMSQATGYHDFSIQTGGIVVFPRLVAAQHRRPRAPEMLPSGSPELDAILGGGMDRGAAHLLLGPTGTGKSTLACLAVATAARRGEKSLMYVFDERVHTLFARAAGLGLPLEQYAASGLVEIRQIDPVELTPGQFAESATRAVEAGASMVVIDSLNGFAYAMPEERLLGLHLHELVSYLGENGVTSLHVMTQHGVVEPTASVFDVSYIADTVILLRPFELAGEVRKAISVHKRRGGHHLRTIHELDLSADGITIGSQPLKEFSGELAADLRHLGHSLTSRNER